MDDSLTRIIEIPKSLPMMTRSVVDIKSRIELIKDIESIVRRSIEYRYYIKYLRQELDLNKCSFLKKIRTGKKQFKKISLEFHHHPFTLWDIVEIMIDKMSFDSLDGRYNAFEVANNVMLLHYRNLVGLVPLTKTVHELVHTNKLHISYEDTYGNVDIFFTDYKYHMSDSNITKYEEYKKKNKVVTENMNIGVLTVKQQRIEMVGVTKLEQIPMTNNKITGDKDAP